ncbi:MAG: hypothetical protein Q8O16_00430, partial [Dehalococcoidia bacterium]|nr:hypothetical protein [Dehalococcoidia bacterium]
LHLVAVLVIASASEAIRLPSGLYGLLRGFAPRNDKLGSKRSPPKTIDFYSYLTLNSASGSVLDGFRKVVCLDDVRIL